MSKNIKVAPSIIATDLSRIGEIAKDMDSNLIDLLHLDVMDGHFVPNITFGPGFISNLKENTLIPFDIHLMIEKPEDVIDQYINIKPWSITISYEGTNYPIRSLKKIRDSGIVAGVAINPATPVEVLFDLLPYIDMVLIMSVEPGFGGQSFMEKSLDRIKRVFDYAKSNGYDDLIIEVDGGITKENISEVVDSGVSVVVAGSSAFKNGEINKNVKDLIDSII